MELAIKGSKKKVEVSETTFGRPFSEALVHQVVTAFLAGGRSGTKATKSRSDARGGGRKPWRQKGTGRARSGTIRSPLWRGGGHTFALRPRSFAQKVNRKMYRGALQAILSELVRQERLSVVEKIDIAEPRTKAVAEYVKDFEGSVLFIQDELDRNLYLGARNLPKVAVIDTVAIDPVTLVGADNVVVTVDALKKIEEWLG